MQHDDGLWLPERSDDIYGNEKKDDEKEGMAYDDVRRQSQQAPLSAAPMTRHSGT